MYDIFHNTENTKYLKGNCHEQLTWKRQPELFKFDSRRHRCKEKPPVYDGERDNSRQKSRFRERKVARKPGMLPQTNLLKRMRSSWQFPFK